MAPLPPRDQRHLWLRYQVEGYTEEIVHGFEQRLKTIFALGLHTDVEIAEDGFGAYWLGSERLVPDKGILVIIGLRFLLARTFLEESLAPEKVTATDLFYLRSMDRGAANVRYLLVQYLCRHAEGRNSGA
ncbi:hypothetical protein Tco_0524256, partial [Tanacetum coccineum]